MKLSKRLALWLSGWFLPLMIRILGSTWRIKWRGLELIPQRGPVIFSIWHGHQLVWSYTCRNWDVVVLVSKSFDGELISRAISKLGFSVIRGSSSKGGTEAFISILNELEKFSRVAITPDGPRGPAYQVSKGIVMLAQKSQAKIFSGVIDASPAIRLSSWDRFMIPLPFAKVLVSFGEPILIPSDMEINNGIVLLQNAMNSLTVNNKNT